MSSTAPFSIGVSSSTMPAATSVDMSLDDLIKARRKEADQQKKKQATAKGRQDPKATKQNKPTKAQKATGASKAKRDAKTAARRGVKIDPKPTPMEIEKQVYRQSRTGKIQQEGGRRSKRIRNQNNNKSEADKKIKKRNQQLDKKKNQKQSQKSQKEEIVKPPGQAIRAAKSALSKAGFNAPKGMKMVVSFVAKEEKQNETKGRNQRGQKNSNNINNNGGGKKKNQSPKNPGRGRGNNRRGGRR